ncbi:hypothetical protein [Flaviaesturariibacter amylovorans]|uniref:hypothetical protein n=1 Tax=Flaviaesturariibacter amylovorans TaxID=1084520 RepID=UPI0031EA319F
MPNRTHIVYLDDDRDDLEVMSMTFAEYAEYELTTFTLPSLFWSFIKANVDQICLVILDFNMPLKTGLEVFQDMQADLALSAIPVVVYTTTVSPVHADAISSLGGVAMQKPTSLDEVRRASRVIIRFCRGND